MSDAFIEQMITVTLPATDRFVEKHHNESKMAIAAMSRSRQWGAETNLRSWRRWINSIDPARDNGWGFYGIELKPGADATLPLGAVIVACDYSWAKAKWYAGQFIQPVKVDAALYEVKDDCLIELTRSMRRAWARDLLGWLVTNRPDVPVTKISMSNARRAM
jgi:hypothetical protein